MPSHLRNSKPSSVHTGPSYLLQQCATDETCPHHFVQCLPLFIVHTTFSFSSSFTNTWNAVEIKGYCPLLWILVLVFTVWARPVFRVGLNFSSIPLARTLFSPISAPWITCVSTWNDKSPNYPQLCFSSEAFWLSFFSQELLSPVLSSFLT